MIAGSKLRLSAKGPAVAKAAVEEGKRTVFLVGEDGETSSHQVTVVAGKTSSVP